MSMLARNLHSLESARGTRAMIARTILAICSVFAGVSSATAEVVWDATRKCAKFAKGSDQAIVLFKARNSGGQSLSIAAASSTCDCASASIDTAQASVDHPGVVRVVLTRSAKHPNPASSVKVTTSDGSQHTLTIDREGTPHVSVVPGLAWWKAGGAAEEREFIVQADRDTLPVVKLTAESTSKNFTCDQQRLDDFRWRVRVKPRSTEKGETASIRCEVTQDGNGSPDGASVVTAHLKIAGP